MNISYWGTRGSVPTFEPETHLYGGNTSCVSISDGKVLIILDAGTGIRSLGDSMVRDMGTHFETHIFLTHFHMDHIQGLGFFKPLFIKGLKIHLWGPPILGESIRSSIGRYLSPPLFPVHLRDVPCDLTLSDVPKEDIIIGDFTVRSDFVCHPGPTLGYRITLGDRSVTYIPDHEPNIGSVDFPHNGEWTSGFDLAYNTDLLIHDAQFTPQEYETKIGWGHSSIQHAIDFAKLAKVSRLDFFHYDPASTDADLEELYVRFVDNSLPFDAYLAKEGQNVVL